MLDQHKKIVGAVYRTLAEDQRMEVWIGSSDETEGARLELWHERGKPFVKNWPAPGSKCCLLGEGGVDEWWGRMTREWGQLSDLSGRPLCGLRTVSVVDTLAWDRSWNRYKN